MTIQTQLPLGRRIPNTLHAVSCSLPTMKDVIGYEEKHVDTLAHMCSGYPRFVIHPLLLQIQGLWARRHRLEGQAIWLTASLRSARLLEAHLAPTPCEILTEANLVAVVHPDTPELRIKARAFLQHIGGFLSSRQAEDYLVSAGERPAVEPEMLYAGDAESAIKSELARLFGVAAASPILLANSGMSAIYATFRAVSDFQKTRGRTRWIQLGWLYLDTMAILRDLSGTGDNYVLLPDVFDLQALRECLERNAGQVAGIMIEAPTNPLVQTPDLAAIRTLAETHGALVVIDPTIASPANVDVLRFADVAVNSLTKYAASEGDVIAGAVVFNPQSPAAALLPAAAEIIEPLYPRDAARLAEQIPSYDEVAAAINVNTCALATHLERHPRVKKVYWALEERSAANFRKIARHDSAVGCMLTLELTGSLTAFYDRVLLAKGPSFGIRTTLLSPFMYMAHYDLVSKATGRERLRSVGIDPDLVRVSVGTEPVDTLIAAFDAALTD